MESVSFDFVQKVLEIDLKVTAPKKKFPRVPRKVL